MKALLLCLMLLPLSAVAAGPGPGPGAEPGAKHERAEKRMRMMLVVGIAEALELNEAEALRLAEKLRSFEDRRVPLRTEMAESMKLLRQAASGDSAALSQVDQATQRVLDNRAKLASMDKEMFNALAKDLNPQRRAQLALFLAQFQRGGKGPGMGPGMGHGPGGGKQPGGGFDGRRGPPGFGQGGARQPE